MRVKAEAQGARVISKTTGIPPGQGPIFRDCPGHSGTVGNDAIPCVVVYLYTILCCLSTIQCVVYCSFIQDCQFYMHENCRQAFLTLGVHACNEGYCSCKCAVESEDTSTSPREHTPTRRKASSNRSLCMWPSMNRQHASLTSRQCTL